MDKEAARQLFHIATGLAALGILLQFGKGFALAAAFFTLVIGTLLMNLRIQGKRLPPVQWFEERFERENAPFPGWGSACYAAGMLMLLSFLNAPAEMAACMFIFAVGDGISTIVGRHGKMRLPYNGGKTLEGAAAFFLSSLPAWAFIGPLALPLAAAAAAAETLPALEDNITVPVACILFLLVA